MIKNGRKPISIKAEPVAKLLKENGENLWVWEPIAPDGYTFLGYFCTLSLSPTTPKVDDCHIRAVPNECLKNYNVENKDMILSEDIKLPTRLFFVSNGKYFKSSPKIEGSDDINLESRDLNDKCLNIERDDNDSEIEVNLDITNIGMSASEAPENTLDESTYNSFKGEFESKIMKHIIENEEILLNNHANNPVEKITDKDENRIKITSSLKNENVISIVMDIRKRSHAYNEFNSLDLVKKIQDLKEPLFKFSLSILGKVYNFENTYFNYKVTSGKELTPSETEELKNKERNKCMADHGLYDLDMEAPSPSYKEGIEKLKKICDKQSGFPSGSVNPLNKLKSDELAKLFSAFAA